MTKRPDHAKRRLELVVDGDRHAIEALHIELRRLAREHGVELAEPEITPLARRRRRARRRRG